MLCTAHREPCGCRIASPVDIQRNPWTFYCRRHGTPLRVAQVKEEPNIDLWKLAELVIQRVFGAAFIGDRQDLIQGTADELRPIYQMLDKFPPGTTIELHGAFLWYRHAEAGVERLPK